MDILLRPLIARARAGMARISMAALCGALAGVAAMASLGCGLAALWIVVLPHAGPAGTALVLAGVLAVLFLILSALAWSLVRRDWRRSSVEPGAEASLLAATQLFRAHKGTMLLAALVAGLNAGAGSGRGK